MDTNAIAQTIRDATDRTDADAALNGLTVNQLNAVAAALNVHPYGAKADRRRQIVQFGCVVRLNSNAVDRTPSYRG